MPFNSFLFACLFLPASVAGYFLVRRYSGIWAKLWLVTASLIFYSAGSLKDLPLLAISLAMNSLAARMLLRPGGGFGLTRWQWLAASVSGNILFLCGFKYAAFFAGVLNALHIRVPTPHASFPLGISFFTIQQIMFLVDCSEDLVEEYNWLDHIVFGSFFAYVTMGPIVRWKQVVPQWNEPRNWRLNADNVANGLYVFVLGLFKKVVLADSFFRWADAGFSAPAPLSLGGAWVAAVSFTFQLYFDFSGYTDMAIGCAQMLNITLPPNFDAPFRARSVAEYWRRWHMTLTNFITTYLYTPMIRSMKRVTFTKGMMATFLSMVIAGIWHGANWTFIIFGALHGVALVVNQVWKKRKWSMPDPLAWLATFVFVVVALVFFRSSTVGQATSMVASMFSLRSGVWNYQPWTGIGRVDQLMGALCMLAGIGILLPSQSIEVPRKLQPSWATVALAVALAGIALIFTNGVVSQSFVYRDF
jgi:D-alanyl-lipoteichoic acid acyltransferase DltB (MBOAT superfamily)